MRWKEKTRVSRERWHTWYAWHPIRINGMWVWLETVHRKGTLKCGWGDCYWEWQYTDTFDILQKETYD